MKKIAVLGLGLIGGSFALALNQANMAEQIAGYDINPDSTYRAKERGAITHICTTPEEAARQADMVVLATPVLAIRELLERIAPVLSPGAIVTDTASTKAQVLNWARALLPANVVFVGGHPMTGKEHSGIEAAETSLFTGCLYCLTPTSETSQETLEQMRVIVTQLGARLWILDAEQHDRLVAGISHLPFVLSTALVQALGADSEWLDMARLAAGGYREMSRLAAGNPVMYRDICLTNREAILGWLEALMLQLESVRELIATSDRALELYFARGKKVRDEWRLPGTTGISREGSTRDGIEASDLDSLRKSLDDIDDALVVLLAERFRVTRSVGVYKKENHLPAIDEMREAALLQRIEELARAYELDVPFIKGLFRLIIDEVVKEHIALM